MRWLYSILGSLLPSGRGTGEAPRRIVIVLPCCIGDVVMGTAALAALRQAYPRAHIAWAVGSWSRPILESNHSLDELIDTGPGALPAASLVGLVAFVRKLRRGRYDLAISLVRSPRISLAVCLSGIPVRAGIDSGGRGFGYNLRVGVDPLEERHEAEIYLDVVHALGVNTSSCETHIDIPVESLVPARNIIADLDVSRPLIFINPAGGSNPGMSMTLKRYPADLLAEVIAGLQQAGFDVVLVGGPDDGDSVRAVQSQLNSPLPEIVGKLTMLELVAAASLAVGYIGCDTGLTHAAAAAGVRTLMIMGPTSPARYRLHNAAGRTVWRPTRVDAAGVGGGRQVAFDWQRDGISPEEVSSAALEHFARRGR